MALEKVEGGDRLALCPPALPFRSRSRSHRKRGIVRTGARGFSLVQFRQRPAVHAAVDDVGS